VTIPAGGSVAFGTSTSAAQYSWVFPSARPRRPTRRTPGASRSPRQGPTSPR
jgi:hypothetical protein